MTTVAAMVLQLEGEARSLLDRLTLEEKLDMLDGDTSSGGGWTPSSAAMPATARARPPAWCPGWASAVSISLTGPGA